MAADGSRAAAVIEEPLRNAGTVLLLAGSVRGLALGYIATSGGLLVKVVAFPACDELASIDFPTTAVIRSPISSKPLTAQSRGNTGASWINPAVWDVPSRYTPPLWADIFFQ